VQEDYTPGSDADFDRLYRVSHPRILRTLIGLLRDRPAAEECAQETFLRAYRGWRRWKPDAPAEAWLHRIALNVATSHRRREGLRTLGNLVRLVGPPREPEAADGGAVSDLVVALRRMPPPQAAIVVLRHHHGYTNREIAAAMGVPESTVASRLAAAKARLRRELGEPEEADAQEFDADIVRTPASRVVKR
jgi:RNA polymerase sigma-70 factor (ECF subfamily)